MATDRQLAGLDLGVQRGALLEGGGQLGRGVGEAALEIVGPLLGGLGRGRGGGELGRVLAVAGVGVGGPGLDLGDPALGGEGALEGRGDALVGGQRPLIGLGGAPLGVRLLAASVRELFLELADPALGGRQLGLGLGQALGAPGALGGVQLGLKGGDPPLGRRLLLGDQHAGLGLGDQELVGGLLQLLARGVELGLVAGLLLGQRAVAGAGGLGGQLVALERGAADQLVAVGRRLGDQALALGGRLGQELDALGGELGRELLALGGDRGRDRGGHGLGLDPGDRGDRLAALAILVGPHRLEQGRQLVALGGDPVELLADPIALGGGLAVALLGVLGLALEGADAVAQRGQLGGGRRELLAGALVLDERPGLGPDVGQLVLELGDLIFEPLGPTHRLVALEQHRGQLVRRRPALGHHLRQQLADALGQRGALILDRRSRLALHRQPVRELVVDAAGRRQRPLRPEHLDEQAADQRDLAGRQRRHRDPLGPDEHPVGAAEILDPHGLAVEGDAGVLARHPRVVGADPAVGGAPDHHRRRAQLVGPIGAVDVAIQQGRHARWRG